MRLYKCNECGGIYEREEMKWTDYKYDEKDLRGFQWPVCPRCGSENVDFGSSCEWCNADLASEFLGDMYVCKKCFDQIVADVTKTVDEFASKSGIEYSTAKEWFIGWAEENQ